MSGFQGYDQWKTASPYDDEPDPYDEAHRFVEENKDSESEITVWAVAVIEALLYCLEENGVKTTNRYRRS